MIPNICAHPDLMCDNTTICSSDIPTYNLASYVPMTDHNMYAYSNAESQNEKGVKRRNDWLKPQLGILNYCRGSRLRIKFPPADPIFGNQGHKPVTRPGSKLAECFSSLDCRTVRILHLIIGKVGKGAAVRYRNQSINQINQ